jgi:hypothetical protein
MNWRYHRRPDSKSYTLNIYRINDTDIQGYSFKAMRWISLLYSIERVARILNLEEIDSEDVFLEMI